MGHTMNKRTLNIVLCLLFIALLVAMPIRNLFFTDIPDNARGQGFLTASYVMLCLFGSLALVFGFRAVKGAR